MKLRPASYLMIGMVGLGARSGCAIKKAADESTQFFGQSRWHRSIRSWRGWRAWGWCGARKDPRGGRERHSYALTEVGEQAVGHWLRSSDTEPTQFREEGVLRLFFADRLLPQERL